MKILKAGSVPTADGVVGRGRCHTCRCEVELPAAELRWGPPEAGPRHWFLKNGRPQCCQSVRVPCPTAGCGDSIYVDPVRSNPDETGGAT